MASAETSGIATGIVTEIGDGQVAIREEGGSEWRVPRAQLPNTVRVGDRVMLCALAGDVGEREALARSLLNQLLSG